jgi:hypothetical protein
MTEFVRYSPGIEAPDLNFDSALQVVLEDVKKQVSASPKFEGGVAVRNAHAKGYGLARGARSSLTFHRVAPVKEFGRRKCHDR